MKIKRFIRMNANLIKNDNRGASLVLSLVVFLVATMVCIVITNAAMTNAAKVKNQRYVEQDYLLLSSAADYLIKAVENDSISYTTVTTLVTVTDDETGLQTTNKSSVTGDMEYNESTEAGNLELSDNLKKMITDTVKSLSEDESGDAYIVKENRFTIKVPDMDELQPVNVVCEIKRDLPDGQTTPSYAVILYMTVQHTEEDYKASSNMSISFEIGMPRKSSSAERIDSNTIKYTEDIAISIGSATVRRG